MSHVDSLSRFSVTMITHDSFILKSKSAQVSDVEICTIKSTKPYKDYYNGDYYLYKFVAGTELFVFPTAMETDKCILVNRKRGKQDTQLNLISKHVTLLYIYQVDHLGLIKTTKKQYKCTFFIIDSFTKFV